MPVWNPHASCFQCIPQKPNIYSHSKHIHTYGKKKNSHSNSFKLPKILPLQLKLRKLMLRRAQNTCHTESRFSPHVVLLSLAIQIILLFCLFPKNKRNFWQASLNLRPRLKKRLLHSVAMHTQWREVPCHSQLTSFGITVSAKRRHYNCRKAWRTFFKWIYRSHGSKPSLKR